MKIKLLISCLVVVSFLLFYTMTCYHILNKELEDITSTSISNYFSYYYPEVNSYKYIKAISNKKNSFQIFVKANNNYYTFNFKMENNSYELLEVIPNVPSYIN